jgi:hypothetical protein
MPIKAQTDDQDCIVRKVEDMRRKAILSVLIFALARLDGASLR